jgi:glutathione-independent formaldehyde dehydrogenase
MQGDQIAALLKEPEVDCAIDCVGFEARGCGHHHHHEVPAQVLNDCMTVTKAGGSIGIPGTAHMRCICVALLVYTVV